MSESLSSTLKEFKYSVVKPIRFYNKVKSIPEYSNISYSQFRARNISFDIFEAAFLNVDNENIISAPQLENIIKYLVNNLKDSRDSDVKNIIIKIEKARVALVTRTCELDEEEDKVAIKNINKIVDELKTLKKIIIYTLKHKNKDIEKEIEFDMLMEELLYPEDYSDTDLLPVLFYNLRILDNSKGNCKKFNERFYKAYLVALHENNTEKKQYYVTLANLIRQANIYVLDRKVINVCGFGTYDSDTKSKLSEKVSRLDFDEKTGRYRLNDFIVTIDNENTSKFDDAISVEKTGSGTYILGIHIADVFSLGIPSLNNESIETKSVASLREHIDKNAISLFVEISKTGLILDKKMLMTNITVSRNLLYDDIPRFFTSRYNDKLCQTVIDLIGLYNIVDNSKLPDYPGPSAIAHALVQKYMLLYGCVVSDMASKNNYPILYQTDSDRKSEVTLNQVYCDTGFNCTNNLTTYARFTSPIWDLRSYINQTSICRCVFDRIGMREENELKLKLSNLKNEINKSAKKDGLQE